MLHLFSAGSKGGLWRTRPLVLAIILVAALVVGVGAGVGFNFVLEDKPDIGDVPVDDSGSEVDEGAEAYEEDDGVRGEATFDVFRATQHVFALTQQIGNRPPGSVGESRAADYIAQQLGEYGYSVEEQAFTLSGTLGSRNLVAERSGKRRGYVIIIGAHYDSSLSGTGALDNASGVGLLLELTRVMSSEEPLPAIEFGFFGANGPGLSSAEERLSGSKHFVDMLGTMEKEEVVGMISVDCIGSAASPTLFTGGAGPQRLKQKLETFLRDNSVPAVISESASDSDNLPFESSGIPGVWFNWSDGATGDSTEGQAVAPEIVEEAGTTLLEFVYGLTEEDLKDLKY